MPWPVPANDGEDAPEMERSKPDREVSEFLLRACHDLRSAARMVRTHTELFLKEAAVAEKPGLEQRLGFIVRGATRMDLLVDGLAGYSVALQTVSASFQSVRMDILLRLVLAKLQRELRACEGEVAYGELPAVIGNPDRLMQVLENLIRNSLMHRGDTAPHIDVKAVRRPAEFLFTVQDNGPGVGPASLEAMFLPFERLGREGGGAGLGLPICRVIVERHGGRIWAESQPGFGASLCFTLPTHER